MRPLSCLFAACVLFSGCGPRVPMTVDTQLQPHELLGVPQKVPAYCAVAEDAVLRRVAIPHTPRWFFKPFADLPLVAYASQSGNNLINLNTGYVIPVPGNRDAVPTPDEQFLTSPGVYLTRVEDLLDEQRRAQPLRLHADLGGEYQSPGLLREFDGGRDYRFMIGRFKPSVRDFRVRGGSGAQLSIEPLGKAWRPCPQHRLHLPMLAKDGREFGAYDVAAGSTRVFAIDGEAGCALVEDLGIPTGKVSFSFDNRLLAFHLAIFDQASVSMAENPDDRWTSNVFVYDRRTRRIGRITHHTAGNAYYPAFRRDGTLVYLFKPLENRYGRYSFAVADPARIRKWLPLRWYTQNCAAGDDGCHRALAIGALWGYTCSKYGAHLTPRLSALNTLSLNQPVCQQLVNDKWSEHRDFVVGGALRHLPDAEKLRALSERDLLGQCS
ncbi:MAG: hypothetical protein OEN20_12410 [Gammaproteobacteria bacterium]|nr:hypothetical protein [Gammaproteobacteria bacterium]